MIKEALDRKIPKDFEYHPIISWRDRLFEQSWQVFWFLSCWYK